jgi:hypothetical protein
MAKHTAEVKKHEEHPSHYEISLNGLSEAATRAVLAALRRHTTGRE